MIHPTHPSTDPTGVAKGEKARHRKRERGNAQRGRCESVCGDRNCGGRATSEVGYGHHHRDCSCSITGPRHHPPLVRSHGFSRQAAEPAPSASPQCCCCCCGQLLLSGEADVAASPASQHVQLQELLGRYMHAGLKDPGFRV